MSRGSYAKTRLVPFGEYVPLRSLLGWATRHTKAAAEDRRRGDGPVVLHTDSLAVGPLISFEATFSDLPRREVRLGAELLAYQSSTSTYQGSWAQPQLASMAAVHAVEVGHPAVHAGLSGVSSAFDARGRKLGWLPATERGVLVVDVPLGSHDDRLRPTRRLGDRVGAADLYGVVCTISTSVLDRRATLAGTDPSSRPAMVESPTLPTTRRSALTSSARSTNASTGAPTIAFSSTFFAPACCARSWPRAGSRRWGRCLPSCSPRPSARRRHAGPRPVGSTPSRRPPSRPTRRRSGRPCPPRAATNPIRPCRPRWSCSRSSSTLPVSVATPTETVTRCSREHGCESPHLNGICPGFRPFCASNVTSVVPT